MSNYYDLLEISKNATNLEITRAYRKLVLTCHPDKVAGKIDVFNQIQVAYETLKDPDERRIYDEYLENPGTDKLRLTNLNIHLVEDPDKYDLYNFLNQLFKFQESDLIKPGQEIEDRKTFSKQIIFIIANLEREKRNLTKKYPNPTSEIQMRINKLGSNHKKLTMVSILFCSLDNRKDLYDYYLGAPVSDEIRQIVQEIGGAKVLAQYISENPEMYNAPAIFALHEARFLTPNSFHQLVQNTKPDTLSFFLLILEDLLEVGILNQNNFDTLILNKQNLGAICHGLTPIKNAEILTQKYFDILVQEPQKAISIGQSIGYLESLGLLNEINWQTIVKKIPHYPFWSDIIAMKQEGLLTQQLCEALAWTSPEELGPINSRIDEMFAHGLFLLSWDTQNARAALLLALELKKELKQFFEKPAQEQKMSIKQFKASFIKTLHSKDQEMSVHRQLWKVIIANILIALTGLGLFAIAANYLIHGSCFFAQTTRNKQIEAIGTTEWLASP